MVAYSYTSQELKQDSRRVDRAAIETVPTPPPSPMAASDADATEIPASETDASVSSQPEEEPTANDPTVAVEAFTTAQAIAWLAARRAITRLACSGYITPQRYIEQFGVPTPEAPWGDRVWHGMRIAFHDACRRFAGSRGRSPWDIAQVKLAFFFVPSGPWPHNSFSRENAQRPFCAFYDSRGPPPFPCIILKIDVEFYAMWCEAILLMKCRFWQVHRSRLYILDGDNAFILDGLWELL